VTFKPASAGRAGAARTARQALLVVPARSAARALADVEATAQAEAVALAGPVESLRGLASLALHRASMPRQNLV